MTNLFFEIKTNAVCQILHIDFVNTKQILMAYKLKSQIRGFIRVNAYTNVRKSLVWINFFN